MKNSKSNKYFRSATIINEGRIEIKNILVEGNKITRIENHSLDNLPFDTEIIDCENLLLLPGVIDSHVHFRQPGLEYKADMKSESTAAVAGGVTTIFDMPNTNPPTISLHALRDKIKMAEASMLCNYKFFFGITNDNVDEALRLADTNLACGLKLFLGSSTGNMLVDNNNSLEHLFANTQMVIVAHCEDEQRIRENTLLYRERFKDKEPTAAIHPLIRDTEACYKSSSFAIDLAKKYNTRLHIAHLTTEKEISLFSSDNIKRKKITCEVSPSHLWFCDEDYVEKGNLIKCNPAIKTVNDRSALRKALYDNRIDLIATDHAPHLLEEKLKPYFNAPSGIPSIQHSLLMMLELVKENVLTYEQIVEKMSHNPAILFSLNGRGFIREGYFADIVLVNPSRKMLITKDNILYKCKWSPLLHTTFSNSIERTFVNGEQVFSNLMDKN
ncbi:MAG: dihydroorotase [Bacteroidales bacterium]|nr:dihydroorotase [Bacteroidales bacterium]